MERPHVLHDQFCTPPQNTQVLINSLEILKYILFIQQHLIFVHKGTNNVCTHKNIPIFFIYLCYILIYGQHETPDKTIIYTYFIYNF